MSLPRWTSDPRVVKVLSWCNDNGISVTYDAERGGEYTFDSKTIAMERATKRREALPILLHECGHAIGRIRLQCSGTPSRRSLVYKCDVLSMEFEAWHDGLELARTLDLDINEKEFFEVRAKHISAYASWVCSKRTKL